MYAYMTFIHTFIVICRTVENGTVLHNIRILKSRCGKGASIYDVRTEGEEVGSKADDSTDRLRDTYSDKGEWVHNPKNFAVVINGSPLTVLLDSLAPLTAHLLLARRFSELR